MGPQGPPKVHMPLNLGLVWEWWVRVGMGGKKTEDPNLVYLARITDLKNILGAPRAPQTFWGPKTQLVIRVVGIIFFLKQFENRDPNLVYLTRITNL
jgi:hypothetical protein